MKELQTETLDQDVVLAQKQAEESGSLTPLLKFELQCKIQARRLKQGKPELKNLFKSPASISELTPEEQERIDKERQKNREAARRLRKKEKMKIDTFLKVIREEQEKTKKLDENIQLLMEEKGKLVRGLKKHRCFYDEDDEGVWLLPKKFRPFCKGKSR